MEGNEAGPLSPRRQGRIRAVEGILRSIEAGGASRAGDNALRRLRAAAARPPRRFWIAAAGAALLAAAGAAALLQRPRSPAETPFRLSEISGQGVTEEPQGARPARPGDELLPGRGLRLAGASCGARLTRSDGSTLLLEGDASLSAGYHPADLVLLQGQISADIHTAPSVRPLTVTTPAAKIEVLGTRFTIAAQGQAARVEVQRGRIRLTRLADGRSLSVAEGHGASVAPGRELKADSSPAPWWNRGWPYRRRLTLAAPEGGETLRDFPLMVLLDGRRIDTGDANRGRSLRFVGADGRTVLPHEIESWDEAGTSCVWVRVPEVGPASPVEPIWMYWGGPAADGAPGSAAVWDARFRLVYHLADAPGAPARDSTARARHGAGTSAKVVAGIAGWARSFDGRRDYIDTGEAEDLAQWTLEAWVRSPAAPGHEKAAGPIMRQNNYQMSWDHFTPQSAGAVSLRIAGVWHSAAFGDLGADRWYYLAGTFDGRMLKAYLDGRPASAVAAPGAPDPSPETAKIARHAQYGDAYFRGVVDEVRVSNAARSEGWIRAQYRSMKDALVTFGRAEHIR